MIGPSTVASSIDRGWRRQPFKPLVLGEAHAADDNHCGPSTKGGPDWMPITPKRGFLFHAETQRELREECEMTEATEEVRAYVLREMPELADRLPPTPSPTIH